MAISFKRFVRANAVLVVGLTLPVLLMAGFLVASGLPRRLADPPQYSLVFAVTDFSPVATGVPLGIRLIVQDGVLKAQYMRGPLQGAGAVNSSWKKLYLYDAATRKVRELPFGFPAGMDASPGIVEETVEATRAMRLDTNLQAPDGYELSYGGSSRGGWWNDFALGTSYASEPRLRKGSSSVRLSSGAPVFRHGAAEFVGWVVGSR